MEEVLIICSEVNYANTEGEWKNCDCGTKVWLSNSSLRAMSDQNLKVVVKCVKCGMKMIDDDSKIVPPTTEQINEITDDLRKRKDSV